ncbi:MAG: hypothetical protein JW995_13675 [Melioribacteraceae bacterium]|nr:hypothetical protein [Melioribacteraceae bacterium]
MLRNIGGVIVGYIAIFITIFVSFTVAYLILGSEGSFQEGTYKVSTAWIFVSILLGLIAAVIGGYISVLIAKNSIAGKILAGLVLILGILTGIMDMNRDLSEYPLARDGSVDNMEAMTNARQPSWFLILNPILGAAGVLIGAGLKKEKSGTTPG